MKTPPCQTGMVKRRFPPPARPVTIVYNSRLSNPTNHQPTIAMAKTYLNVPYAQKDAAKALGARWDAAQKKWYVPPDKDASLFAQWQAADGTAVATTSPPKKAPAAAKPAKLGVVTPAEDKNFVAYNGDEPPWD